MDVKHHVVITGTGRAGTTLLVKLFTRLGLATGYDLGHRVNPISNAGLEWNMLRDQNLPYIVKSPAITGQINRILARKDLCIDHAIVCMRRLEDAAQSRRRVQAENRKLGRENGPGGVTGRGDPEELEGGLAERFHKLIDYLSEAEIPITFLHFPKYTKDADYFVRQISAVFPNLDESVIRDALAAEVRPELVHSFS